MTSELDKKAPVPSSNAPEGGWGWFIVLAYAVNNMVVLPIIIVFTLIYNSIFERYGFTAVQKSTIIGTNISFGMLLALFNGPILRNFGFRKVAFMGSIFVFVGNVFTSQSSSFIEFLFWFGLIVSIGTNWVMAAFNLALNTYFVTKRGVATGIAMTLTGFGPIFMPLIASWLVSEFDNKGAGLIISAISAHAIVASLLLQPVKWHRKRVKIDEMEMAGASNADSGKKDERRSFKVKCTADQTTEQHENNHEEHSVKTDNTIKVEQQEDVCTVTTKLMSDENHVNEIKESANEKLDVDKSPTVKSLDDIVKRHDDKWWERVITFFDFDLLNDWVYINISLGLAFAFVSEMSFTLMLPIILQDFGLEYNIAAYMMSCLAVADILSRFVSPFIGDSLKSRVRIVYLFSLICGIIFRICLFHATTIGLKYIVVALLGFTKGIRCVYTVLILPSYVPLSKLPAAQGLQMVFNGIMLFISEPLLGISRDKTRNYDLWIQVINYMAAVTIVLWATEMYLLFRQKQGEKPPIVRRVPT